LGLAIGFCGSVPTMQQPAFAGAISQLVDRLNGSSGGSELAHHHRAAA
jgi:hypothetical protein